MSRPRTILLFLLSALVTASSAGAQPDPKAGGTGTPSRERGTISPPRGSLRISGHVWVGDTAPDFELLGSRGGGVSLNKQRGDWVLLVFARDKSVFDDLGAVPPELARLGAKMFGITRERISALRTHAEKLELGFELLSDPTGDISAIYGSFDSEANLPRPGYVLIDRRGVVKLSVIGQTFPPDQVLTLVTLTIQAQ